MKILMSKVLCLIGIFLIGIVLLGSVQSASAQNFEKKITVEIPTDNGQVKCIFLKSEIKRLHNVLVETREQHRVAIEQHHKAVEDRLSAVDGSEEERRLYFLEIDSDKRRNHLSDYFDAVYDALEELLDTSCRYNENVWHRHPTFGISHNTNFKQLVDIPLRFNHQSVEVDDNWHVEFSLLNQTVNTKNSVSFAVNVYDGLKWIQLSLGIPEVGHMHKSQSNIVIYFDVDYTQDVIYQISDIVHEQKENFVNANMTSASIQSAQCVNETIYDKCYLIGIDFTVENGFDHNVFSISAVDTKRRVINTFFNEGVRFIDDSPEPEPMPEPTEGHNQKKDKWNTVMKRENSNFKHLIDAEIYKAELVFNGTHFNKDLSFNGIHFSRN